MKTFILIPGAGGAAWYWHRVTPLVQQAGRDAVAVDLPADDETKGIDAYADLVVEAASGCSSVVLVAQSMGAFSAALAAQRLGEGRLERIVFVNAMIPLPGETAGAWWGATDWETACKAEATRRGYPVEFDDETYFLHDVPKDVVAAGAEHQRGEAKIAFTQPARFERWPKVPLHVVIGKDDRFFPRDFQVRVARERLGADVDIAEIPGGHLAALSHPRELAAWLLAHA